MSNFAVIASGQSLTKEYCLKIKSARELGIIQGVIAVSNVGIDHAPWADVLVSHDTSWWRSYSEANAFKGWKYSCHGDRDIRSYKPPVVGCNSGLMAMFIARDEFKAKKILLIGFDMHGTHYFGKHERDKLVNTDQRRFNAHISQFKMFHGCDVVNCTPNSALDLFTKSPLDDILEKWKLAE